MAYEYDHDCPFEAFITNLGKYNEGELVGEWVKFPTTSEELKKVFERSGIGSKDDFGNPYEEWFISDYDCYVDGLYEKLGIRYVSITSGVNKDSFRLTDEQIAIYQSQVNESYERFVQTVADGRGMSVEQVKVLADGRTYTAAQAKENGLIDMIDTYENMQIDMANALQTYDFYALPDNESEWSALFGKVEELIPKSEAQILKETADEMESGVLMYYAK